MNKKIEVKKGVFYEVQIRNCGRGFWGECVAATKEEPGELAIRPGLSKKNTRQTLIHELIHAVDYEWVIGLTEEQTLQLEEAFCLLIKLNDFNGLLD